jgi:DNA-binding transcriptional regulator YhcF (GntR family)
MKPVTIDRGLDRPVYAQIADQLRRLVASGDLRPGTPLPTVRGLAGDLGVNLNTVARAYRVLEAEGFLHIRGRGGAVVAQPAASIPSQDRSELVERLRVVLARLKQAGMSTDQLNEIIGREIRALERTKEGWGQ